MTPPTPKQRERIYRRAAEHFLSRKNEFYGWYFSRTLGADWEYVWYKRLSELECCLYGMPAGYGIYLTGKLRGMLCLFAAEMCRTSNQK